VSVKDASAIGRNFQLTLKPYRALFAEKSVAHHLHISGSKHQANETQGNAGHDELATPNGRFAGQ
jgi:hypothetical protein